jgi:hypothetical protein
MRFFVIAAAMNAVAAVMAIAMLRPLSQAQGLSAPARA